MVWLDLDVEPAPDTGTPSVEAHSSKVNYHFDADQTHPLKINNIFIGGFF